ncbi:hypothetical protein M422DRAFT_238835 [Sphaerobolus stellatus SS14]|nr:hypothetical protein M422DRAFT_238835 [Sphaerobolus stellatus SS14]
MSLKSPLPPNVEALKAQGNSLFVKGQHLQAIEKYTAAIDIIADNAILFANRAASFLALEKYADALSDATKATLLDPSYAKGWGRVGMAHEGLKNKDQAKSAYQRAIACMDATGIEPNATIESYVKLRTNYVERFLAFAGEKGYEFKRIMFNDDKKRIWFPWDLAKNIPSPSPQSSARTIMEAEKLLEKAMERIYKVKEGNYKNGGIFLLSEALMLDGRCFFISEQHNFFRTYNEYKEYEIEKTGACVHTGDPNEIIRLAKKQLVEEGWDRVRDALAVTIRGLFLKAFVGGATGTMSCRDHVAWCLRIVTLLELGRETWAHVSREDKGTIFDNYFLAKMRSYYMDAYMKLLDAKSENHQKFKLEELERLNSIANGLLEDLEGVTPEIDNCRPGYVTAFYSRPKAEAHAMLGYVHARKSKFRASNNSKLEDILQAAKAYNQAGDIYPEDDENHCLNLCIALNYYSQGGSTAAEKLKLMKRIRLSYEKMEKIWKQSAATSNGMRSSHLPALKVEAFEPWFREQVESGKVKPSDTNGIHFNL